MTPTQMIGEVRAYVIDGMEPADFLAVADDRGPPPGDRRKHVCCRCAVRCGMAHYPGDAGGEWVHACEPEAARRASGEWRGAFRAMCLITVGLLLAIAALVPFAFRR